ncbi:MAG TPA: hypothetical protein VFH61_14305 [Thermoleophilia bacterium]|nr:hypothetical protein [Thermoleophilia bacterium]
MSRFSKWAQKEHSDSARTAIMLLAGPVFLGLLPFVVAGVGPVPAVIPNRSKRRGHSSIMAAEPPFALSAQRHSTGSS